MRAHVNCTYVPLSSDFAIKKPMFLFSDCVMYSGALASFFTKTFKVDDEEVTFEIWDTAGQGQ